MAPSNRDPREGAGALQFSDPLDPAGGLAGREPAIEITRSSKKTKKQEYMGPQGSARREDCSTAIDLPCITLWKLTTMQNGLPARSPLSAAGVALNARTSSCHPTQGE
jgi:hypothetical protein